MHNTNAVILLALFIALSTGLAEARVAGGSQSVSLCSRDTSPPQQEWSSLRPAAKATAQEGVCSSVDVAALTGDALINYLRTTSKGCLERTLHISDNPAIRADVPTIFSNRNMQSIFAEIEKLAATYDGTNSTGMIQLWGFVQVGYDYHRFFPGTGVGPFDAATDRAYLAASDAFAASDHFYAPNDDDAQIMRDGSTRPDSSTPSTAATWVVAISTTTPTSSSISCTSSDAPSCWSCSTWSAAETMRLTTPGLRLGRRTAN